MPTRSFGGIGIFAIPEMGRFYRHVLIQKRYPHHGAVAFAHVGKALFEVLKYLGVQDIEVLRRFRHCLQSAQEPALSHGKSLRLIIVSLDTVMFPIPTGQVRYGRQYDGG